MLKPLSQKTLEKKYAELGLPQEKIELLHTYFLCFANLYGVIAVRDAWDIFKHYEGSLVRRKDFAAFSGIVQREAGHPYSVFELKEIYCEEETNDPLERMIVNNELILSGYNRFIYVYPTVKGQENKPYYLPGKQVFLSFFQDQFFLTPSGKAMKTFVDNLRTSGISKNYHGEPNGELTDLNGIPIKGKRLSDCVFYTQNELFDIDYAKAEAKKQKLRDKYSISASAKVLKRIKLYLSTGGVFENESASEELLFLVDSLDRDYGVSLSFEQFEQFTELFTKLNNSSNLWLNCGWSPEELYRRFSPGNSKSISVGSNMKKMIESEGLNIEEFERELAKMGITLTDE